MLVILPIVFWSIWLGHLRESAGLGPWTAPVAPLPE